MRNRTVAGGVLGGAVVVFCAMGVVLGQAAPPATHPIDESVRLAAIKAAELTRVGREAAAMPSLGTMKLADVMRVQLVDGRLVATTSVNANVAPDSPGVWLMLAGLPGTVQMREARPRPAQGRVGFNFLYQDASRADNVMTTVQVLSSEGTTEFSSTDDGLERTRSVSLIEATRAGVHAITLRVDDTPSEWSFAAAPEPAKVLAIATAGDFMQLRLQHPADVDAYVRPMFRFLGQESAVFAVSRSTAWLALADEFVVDPALQKKIEGIIPRLGADEFAVRNAASEELAVTGIEGVLTLRKMGTMTLSAEQKSRIEAFERSFTSVDVTGMADDREFLLDCLYTDDAALRGAATKRLSKLLDKKIEWKPVDSDAARDAEIQKLRDDAESNK